MLCFRYNSSISGTCEIRVRFPALRKDVLHMQSKIPVAYKGDEPYIFISYAHKDAETVLPIVDRL